MKRELQNEIYPSIYPGNYVPLLKKEEVEKELRQPHEGKMLFPPVNVTELMDVYKVEMAIPGVRREDFLVQSDANILSIQVLHKENATRENESFQIHEFNYECFDRHIILPLNADTEFTCAEYKAGILRLHMPKTNSTGNNRHTKIVVY
ncbi:MAG: Hsp20/alpha crystallin family protein [Chitinophagaceae bacterium]